MMIETIYPLRVKWPLGLLVMIYGVIILHRTVARILSTLLKRLKADGLALEQSKSKSCWLRNTVSVWCNVELVAGHRL
jgi:hypothetical protein